MAAPNPLVVSVREKINQRGGLVVMHQDKVGVHGDGFAVHLVVVHVGALFLLRQLHVHALQGVVDFLGDFEEVKGALDDFPVGV